MKLIASGSTWLLLFLWVIQFPLSSAVTPRPILRTSPLTKELEDKKALYYFRKQLRKNPSITSNRRVSPKPVPGVNFDTGSRRPDGDPSQQSPAEDRMFIPPYKFPFWGLPYGVYSRGGFFNPGLFPFVPGGPGFPPYDGVFGGPYGPGSFPGPGPVPFGPGPTVPPLPPVPPVPPPVAAGGVAAGIAVGGAGGAVGASGPGSGPGPPTTGSYYGWSGGRHRKIKKPQIPLDPETDEDQGPCQSTPYNDSYKPPSKKKPPYPNLYYEHGSGGAGGRAPVSKPAKYKLLSEDVPPNGCKYGEGPRCQKKYPIRQPEPDPVYQIDDDAGVVDDYVVEINDYPQPGHVDYPPYSHYMYPLQ